MEELINKKILRSLKPGDRVNYRCQGWGIVELTNEGEDGFFLKTTEGYGRLYTWEGYHCKVSSPTSSPSAAAHPLDIVSITTATEDTP